MITASDDDCIRSIASAASCDAQHLQKYFQKSGGARGLRSKLLGEALLRRVAVVRFLADGRSVAAAMPRRNFRNTLRGKELCEEGQRMQ